MLLPEVDAEQLVVRPPPLLAGGLQQRLGAGVEAALAERLEDDAVRGHDGLGVAVEPVEREREVPREPALQVRIDEAAVRDKVRRDAIATHVVDEVGEDGAAPPTRRLPREGTPPRRPRRPRDEANPEAAQAPAHAPPNARATPWRGESGREGRGGAGPAA